MAGAAQSLLFGFMEQTAVFNAINFSIDPVASANGLRP